MTQKKSLKVIGKVLLRKNLPIFLQIIMQKKQENFLLASHRRRSPSWDGVGCRIDRKALYAGDLLSVAASSVRGAADERKPPAVDPLAIC